MSESLILDPVTEAVQQFSVQLNKAINAMQKVDPLHLRDDKKPKTLPGYFENALLLLTTMQRESEFWFAGQAMSPEVLAELVRRSFNPTRIALGEITAKHLQQMTDLLLADNFGPIGSS